MLWGRLEEVRAPLELGEELRGDEPLAAVLPMPGLCPGLRSTQPGATLTFPSPPALWDKDRVALAQELIPGNNNC